MATIKIKILGEPNTISLNAWTSALESSWHMLSELDMAISGEISGSIDWVVKELSTGSLVLVVESVQKIEDKNFGEDVSNAFVNGLDQIEHQGTTPPFFSERGMKKAQSLLKLIGKEGTQGLEIGTQHKSVELTARASANIDQLMLPRTHSIGSIEGRLETVSLHGKKPKFTVYQARTQKAVSCSFDEAEWLDKIKDALGHRVNINGTVHFNIKAEPVRVDFSKGNLRILRKENELPSVDELTGSDPNFTEGQTTEEYLRNIRGG